MLINQDLVSDGHNIIEEIIAKWNPVSVFVGFSGGDDSLASTHFCMNHLGDRARVLHINTRIGIERTREFVRETCRRQAWPLWERFAAGEAVV